MDAGSKKPKEHKHGSGYDDYTAFDRALIKSVQKKSLFTLWLKSPIYDVGPNESEAILAHHPISVMVKMVDRFYVKVLLADGYAIWINKLDISAARDHEDDGIEDGVDDE